MFSPCALLFVVQPAKLPLALLRHVRKANPPHELFCCSDGRLNTGCRTFWLRNAVFSKRMATRRFAGSADAVRRCRFVESQFCAGDCFEPMAYSRLSMFMDC